MKRFIPISIILIGLGAIYPLQRWMDETMPREAISEESLYFASGKTIRKMSLGLDAIVADIYWIRTVQYFGRKVLESGQPLSMTSTRNVRMELLAPLLNIIVELDPQHLPAYRFGAIFLPERDPEAAIALLERGIRENPSEWRLYQDLAYIYWQAGDYNRAADYYEEGGQVPGAMWWMRDMAGFMRLKGGSREAARAIYLHYAESEDERIRTQAVSRLKQLQALDEIDAVNEFLSRQKQTLGRCPESLKGFARNFRNAGLRLNEDQVPTDPDGFAYEFDAATCTVNLATASTIPRS